MLIGRRQLLGPFAATALVLLQEKFFSLGGYVDKIVLGSVLSRPRFPSRTGWLGLARPLAGRSPHVQARRLLAHRHDTPLEHPK